MLGLVIFGLIRGMARVWKIPTGIYDWLQMWYGEWSGRPHEGYWHQLVPAIITVLVLLLVVIIVSIFVRKRSRDTYRVEGQALVLGSWVLYLPSFMGGLLAVLGFVGMMTTPFLGGGGISILGVLLKSFGSTYYLGDWISRGAVGSFDSYQNSEASHYVIGQVLVAIGLAITIIGFIQVFRAYRERRLQTQGLYTTVRHPQHLGIALWTFGLAFAVNGTAGYMMSFTVVYFYILLALREERHLVGQFGSVYEDYRRATPFMIPLVNIGLPIPKSGIPRVTALFAYYVGGMLVLCCILQEIGVVLATYI